MQTNGESEWFVFRYQPVCMCLFFQAVLFLNRVIGQLWFLLFINRYMSLVTRNLFSATRVDSNRPAQLMRLAMVLKFQL